MLDQLTIRPLDVTNSNDVASATAIYRHHVLHGTGSFEITPPTEAQMQDRFTKLADQNFPIILACIDEAKVAGFAYFGPYKERAAYRHTVEDSIYVAPEAIGKGIGKEMLTHLVTQAHNAGFAQMMAVIGDADNRASIGLHQSVGFEKIGQAKDIGFKFGRYLDVVYMQKSLSLWRPS